MRVAMWRAPNSCSGDDTNSGDSLHLQVKGESGAFGGECGGTGHAPPRYARALASPAAIRGSGATPYGGKAPLTPELRNASRAVCFGKANWLDCLRMRACAPRVI